MQVWILKPRNIVLNQWNEASLKILTEGFNTKLFDLGDMYEVLELFTVLATDRMCALSLLQRLAQPPAPTMFSPCCDSWREIERFLGYSKCSGVSKGNVPVSVLLL